MILNNPKFTLVAFSYNSIIASENQPLTVTTDLVLKQHNYVYELLPQMWF